MKRLERLGTIAFATITISLVFHLLAMSSNHWIDNNCVNCSLTNMFGTWRTALRQRCYISSIGALFVPESAPVFDIVAKAFIAEVCLPNQFLKAKKSKYAYDCLQTAINISHAICSIKLYDPDMCECDYSGRTKGVLATTILASLLLGVMVFMSHTIAYIRHNYILRWLFPISFAILGFTAFLIVATLAIFSATKNDDVDELIFSSTLLQAAFQNETIVQYWKEELSKSRSTQYVIQIGWCFGMEILSLQFLLATLIIFILMYIAKNRPEQENS